MKMRVFFLYALTAVLSLGLPLFSQTEFVTSSYFPADQEFWELGRVLRDVRIEDVSGLQQLRLGVAFEELGFTRYARRSYQTSAAKPLQIEIFTFADGAGSYSLLTLLAPSPVVSGPPGEAAASDAGTLVFQQGQYLVRISASDVPELCQRIARSMSNRIGPRKTEIPALLSHLPDEGFKPASLRYLLGVRSLDLRAHGGIGGRLEFPAVVEAAQAEYELQGEVGMLTLLSFPTMQLAGEYFDSGALHEQLRTQSGIRIYARRAGPLISIVAGRLSPSSAAGLLGSLKYAYTVQWIYDKNSRSGKTIWGVPVVILGTVVRSLFFVAALAGLSVVLGIAFAAFRLGIRAYAPNNPLDRPERTELIRLKINED